MNTVNIYCVNTGEKRIYPIGVTLEEIKDDFQVKLINPILGALVNNKVKELSFVFVKNKKVEFIDYSHPDGMRLYIRSLFFILFAAVREVFPEVKLKMMHGISRGYYCELAGLNRTITDSDIFAIKSEMRQLVVKDIPFEKIGLPTEEAVEICNKQNLRYKAKLFEQQGAMFSYLYFMGDQANYFYGHQVPSTGYLQVFDLVSYYDGLLLRIPNPNKFSEVQPYSTNDKLFEVFQEHKDWAEILNVPNVANLNENAMNGLSGDIIKISEAFHEKKIAEIANLINERRDKVKIVLIAGPSASGKTTFSKRLMVDGASLVCSVESTICPVKAALTAISAVSKSRISPIMIISGSWRRNERSAAAKLRPISSCICTWLMPAKLNSTGSSAVEIFSDTLFSSAIAE